MYLCTIWCYMLMSAMTLAAAAAGTKTTSELPSPTPGNIIDILSSQAQYSYFLRHLQVKGMVPLINSLENVTILAPINSAFIDGNIAFEANLLLRYIINQKVRVGWLGEDEVIYSTLYPLNKHDNYTVSIVPNCETREYIIDNISAIVDPDIYAKNQYSFIQGIEKLLPMKPDLCDVLLNKQPTLINGKDITFIKTLFQTVLTKESCTKYLASTRTLFIPTDDYIVNSLSAMQQQYYLSLFDILSTTDFITTTKEAKQEFVTDIYNVLDYLKLSPFIVGVNGTSNSTYEGFRKNMLHLDLKHHSLLVNGVAAEGNMVMANGVIHIFDQQKNQPDFFQALNVPIVDMIPRKVLNALHFSKFTKELNFRNLQYLIDGSSSYQSLFLDINSRDDIQDDSMFMKMKGELETQAFSSKQTILYQFGDSINITKEIGNKNEVYKLIPSRLCSKKKIGGCFDLKVASTKMNNECVATLNDDLEILDGPIDMGNSSFLYIVDSDITAPTSLKHALGDIMSSGSVPRHTEHFAVDKQSCLTTLENLNKFKLLSLADNNQGYSIFLPCGMHAQDQDRNNWDDLGLVYNYLKSNPKLFKEIMKGMFIEDVIYTDNEKSRTTTNLNGDVIQIKSVRNNGEKSTMKLNNTELEVPPNTDILFNQGVIHLIDKVMLPDYFHVPFLDLIKTTVDERYPHHSILSLIDLFPKIGSALGLNGPVSKPYSLLVPSADALKEYNITTNYQKLLEFIEFHLIPNDQLGKLLTCVGENHYDKNISDIRTNLTKTSLTCYQSKSGNRFLKLIEPVAKLTRLDALSYNKDREVKIINYGCTQVRRDRKSIKDLQCVFLLEKPLNLQWLRPKNDNLLHVHLGFISLGIGIIFGLIIFGIVMFFIVLCVGKGDKQTNKVTFEDNLSNNENHFMRVRLDNEEHAVHDRGYDTDIDILRDNDEFLPLYGTKKIYKKRDYGSTRNQEPSSNNNNSIHPVSSPRNIKNCISSLARDRNLPPDM